MQRNPQKQQLNTAAIHLALCLWVLYFTETAKDLQNIYSFSSAETNHIYFILYFFVQFLLKFGGVCYFQQLMQ